MDFIKKLLKEGKISQDVAQGIEEKFSALQKQAEEYKAKLEETQKTLNEVSESKSKLENELNNLDEKIKKAKEEGKAELVKELEAERAEKQELMQKLNTLEAKNKELTINSELSKILDEIGVVDKEVASLALKHFVDVEDGKVIFKNGEEVLDLKTGASKFFENKPHLLTSKGNQGSGANNPTNQGGIKKRGEMSLEEKAEFIAQNGREAYEQLPE